MLVAGAEATIGSNKTFQNVGATSLEDTRAEGEEGSRLAATFISKLKA